MAESYLGLRASRCELASRRSLYNLIQAGYQSLVVHGLAQEADGAVVECLPANTLFWDSRYEYEGDLVTRAAQVSLKLYPAHDWHANVTDHAQSIMQLLRFEEVRS